MKKKSNKKLMLSRETVRNLTSRDLAKVGGGMAKPEGTDGCHYSGDTCSMGTNHNETLLRARRASR